MDFDFDCCASVAESPPDDIEAKRSAVRMHPQQVALVSYEAEETFFPLANALTCVNTVETATHVGHSLGFVSH